MQTMKHRKECIKCNTLIIIIMNIVKCIKLIVNQKQEAIDLFIKELQDIAHVERLTCGIMEIDSKTNEVKIIAAYVN